MNTVLEAEEEEKESFRMSDEANEGAAESKPKWKKASKKGKGASNEGEEKSWNEGTAKGMSQWNEDMKDAWDEPDEE
eukprot:2585585-Karenia_brevis.AAC.1